MTMPEAEKVLETTKPSSVIASGTSEALTTKTVCGSNNNQEMATKGAATTTAAAETVVIDDDDDDDEILIGIASNDDNGMHDYDLETEAVLKSYDEYCGDGQPSLVFVPLSEHPAVADCCVSSEFLTNDDNDQQQQEPDKVSSSSSSNGSESDSLSCSADEEEELPVPDSALSANDDDDDDFLVAKLPELWFGPDEVPSSSSAPPEALIPETPPAAVAAAVTPKIVSSSLVARPEPVGSSAAAAAAASVGLSISRKRKNPSSSSDGDKTESLVSKIQKTESTPAAAPGASGGSSIDSVVVVVPNEKDVLCGKGGGTLMHNRHFTALCIRMSETYAQTTKRGRQGKKGIALQIVKEIQVNGGRFLRREGNEWSEISDNQASDKVAHCIRDLSRRKEKMEAAAAAAAAGGSPISAEP